jgi:EAL domain-containing protein (putative c-di-GMP-specific phosphodiesterase class I)
VRDLATAAAIMERPAERDDPLEVVHAGLFGVQYEPIVDARSGRVHAYEALARFHLPGGMSVPPTVVFDRLRGQPDLLVRTELALKRLQIAHAPGPRVFLNVSASTWVLSGGRPFRALFATSPVPVVVEAVECMNPVAAVHGPAMLRELLRAGIPAALDDLGAAGGLISAEELHLARILKFDRSVLRHLEDPSRRALLEALLTFARRTGKQVVAEGVETARDLVAVRELGFDLAQGDLFREDYRRIQPSRC